MFQLHSNHLHAVYSHTEGKHENYKVCCNSNETDFIYKKSLHFNMIPFKVVPFGSNTLFEVVLPCLEALLEVFFHEVLQSVGYSSQDVVNCPALMFS